MSQARNREIYGPTTPETTYTADVISVGDTATDYFINLDHPDLAPLADNLDAFDWFPADGESILVDDLPDYVDAMAAETAPGGRGPNQAVAAARSGADTELLSVVGDHETLQDLQDDDVTGLTTYTSETTDSAAYVFTDGDGGNRIAFDRSDTPLTADDVKAPDTAYDSAAYLLLNNGEPDDVIQTVLEQAETVDEPPSVIFDPAPADGAEQWLDYDAVDIVTPNEQEYAAIEDALAQYDGTVIQTDADGAVVDDTYRVAAPAVEPVDTTGAGDTFNGYLAGCLAQGESFDEALEYAVTAASLSVTEHGAQPSVPTYDAVEAYMESDQ